MAKKKKKIKRSGAKNPARRKKRTAKRAGHIPMAILKRRYAKLGNIIAKRRGQYE